MEEVSVTWTFTCSQCHNKYEVTCVELRGGVNDTEEIKCPDCGAVLGTVKVGAGSPTIKKIS